MSAALRVSDLTVAFNRIPAIHHLAFELPPGSCTGLLGPNGAGKTTLLKAVARLLPLETGKVRLWDGQRESSLPPGGIAYVPQREAVDWDFPITVRGLVEMGRFPHVGLWKRFSKNDRTAVDEALAVADLGEFADRQIRALSGGQQQRAFLARAWAQDASIYLLDEPFGGLDQNARAAFTRALHRLRDAGKTILASHHELNEVPAIFDRVLLINGELVACGPTPESFTEANRERAFSTRIFSGHPHAGHAPHPDPAAP